MYKRTIPMVSVAMTKYNHLKSKSACLINYQIDHPHVNAAGHNHPKCPWNRNLAQDIATRDRYARDRKRPLLQMDQFYIPCNENLTKASSEDKKAETKQAKRRKAKKSTKRQMLFFIRIGATEVL